MIAVLDYGIGNLRSAEKALQRVGADARLTTDPAEVSAADGVVLPGVGAFASCMAALVDSGLDRAVHETIAGGRPFLGICVGMQLLYEGSEESPGVAGLGLLPGIVRHLPDGLKRPQMQWNRLTIRRPSPLLTGPVFEGSGADPWVYFVHSFAAPGGESVVATTDYGGPVTALVQRDRLWATQFHPEKSGRTGLALLAAFVAGCTHGSVPTPPPRRSRASVALMDLFAAIDLRDGRCVRLVEGDFAQETVYSDDPVVVARNLAAGGSHWIHVVDLDAARTGRPVNRPVVERIVAAVTVPVQVGGGVRSVDDAAALFAAGVTRVVVGTAAVEQPQIVADIARRWPGRVAVGLDHRDGEVMLRGWVVGGGRRVVDLVPEVVEAGAAAVIVTDIGRDGRLSGPDVVGLAGLLEETGAPIVASGGVSGAEDLRLLAAIRAGGQGLRGVVVGKAIYEGALTVAEAVAACGSMSGPG